MGTKRPILFEEKGIDGSRAKKEIRGKLSQKCCLGKGVKPINWGGGSWTSRGAEQKRSSGGSSKGKNTPKRTPGGRSAAIMLVRKGQNRRPRGGDDDCCQKNWKKAMLGGAFVGGGEGHLFQIGGRVAGRNEKKLHPPSKEVKRGIARVK